jgi:hypothetical protein
MKKLDISFLLVALLGTLQIYAQAPTKVWDKTIGGSGDDDNTYSIIKASDGGFVIAGSSDSNISGDKSEVSKGNYDFWIVKLNSSGQKIWDKTIGGSDEDKANSIIATDDGGFIVAGYSLSGISGDKTEASKGSADFWVVKLNSVGQKVWDKTIGGNGSDGETYSIISTADGGFVIAGYSNSGISGDKTEINKGYYDYWMVKINSSGQVVWDKTIGGDNYDLVHSMTSTNDGGFVVVGLSYSGISGDKTEASRGAYDYWVVKLNSLGQKVWDKTIGGSGADGATSVIATSDGGFVITGSSSSGTSGDKTEASKGTYDFWIVKLNSSGQKIWDKTIGGSSDDFAFSSLATSDGSVVIIGQSSSGIAGDKTEASKGLIDFWIVKLNSSGQKIWDKTIGGSNDDFGYSIINTNDGGFVLGGQSSSGVSGDKTEVNRGSADYWIVKLSGSDNCPSTLTPTGIITSNQKAANSISTTGINTIPNASNVIYQGGNFVQLNAGFSAASGSVFLAKILAGCQ